MFDAGRPCAPAPLHPCVCIPRSLCCICLCDAAACTHPPPPCEQIMEKPTTPSTPTAAAGTEAASTAPCTRWASGAVGCQALSLGDPLGVARGSHVSAGRHPCLNQSLPCLPLPPKNRPKTTPPAPLLAAGCAGDGAGPSLALRALLPPGPGGGPGGDLLSRHNSPDEGIRGGTLARQPRCVHAGGSGPRLDSNCSSTTG